MSNAQKAIVDLRTYTIRRGGMPLFVRLAETHVCPVMLRHIGAPLAFFGFNSVHDLPYPQRNSLRLWIDIQHDRHQVGVSHVFSLPGLARGRAMGSFEQVMRGYER